MRLLILALGCGLLAAPAMAHPLGSAVPAHPSEGSPFQGPSTGALPDAPAFTDHRTAMQRLRQLCASNAAPDQRTCAQAWQEINAAYRQLQASRATGPSLQP